MSITSKRSRWSHGQGPPSSFPLDNFSWGAPHPPSYKGVASDNFMPRRRSGTASLGVSVISDPTISRVRQEQAKKISIAEKVAEDEGKALARLKEFGYRLVLLVAVGLGLAAFFTAQTEDIENYELNFQRFSSTVITSANENVQTALNALESMTISSSSLASFQQVDWPFVTLPDFAENGADTRHLSSSPLLVFSPSVNESDRMNWEMYAMGNQQWIEEGYEYEGLMFKPEPIPLLLHTDTQDRALPSAVPLYAPGPFSPVWQMSPAPNVTSIVNYDLRTDPTYLSLEISVVDTQLCVLSDFLNTSTLFGSSAPDTGGSPQSVLLQPVLETSTGQVSAILTAILFWQVYFEGILPTEVVGIVVVLADSTGHAATFELSGPNVTYQGNRDLHDPEYSDMVAAAPFACFPVNVMLIDAATGEATQPPCDYHLYVYPSATFQAADMTNHPFIYCMTVVLIVFCTTLSFMLFDWYTQRQEDLLITKAERTHALVSSLFPENLHDRLIGKSGAKNERKVELTGKAGLRTYLNDTDVEGDGVDLNSKPIAELFPNTTVMFCDIVGFTAWSSTREPAQIFMLLETIFSAFDEIAKMRGVFKVETVGDCYVAVAGLPEPREDHAIVMARFARHCMKCLRDLMPKLEITLGPDTGDLAMRFGLHSGPVIAGVLRSERARFQLFGDTMNTTARIETSSQRGKIHMSQETAELLIQAGKEKWVEKREDAVFAKGKGEMVTYWLTSGRAVVNPSAVTVASTPSSVPSEPESERSPSETSPYDKLDSKTGAEDRMERLVDWNCDLLQQILKKIVARRKGRRRRSVVSHNQERTKKLEVEIMNRNLLDELVEFLPMPKFDEQGAKDELDAGKIVLTDSVQEELREFIRTIACMYHDNPFHCFEHASHVTMSVSKLLARIVAPDEVHDKHDGADKQSDLAGMLHDHTYGITSDPLIQFAVVLSALIHDVDHRGVPNFVLEREDPILAQTYKHKSVAEQNSMDLAWNALMDRRFVNLRRCIYSSEAELEWFRKLLVNSVMATDIFDKELGQLRKRRWETAFSSTSGSTEVEEAIHRKATIVIEHLIQASDVAHTMQHWHIYLKWNERLFQEMYTAYQQQRTDKDPSVSWYQGEIGFFDNYIIPLAKKLEDCGVFGVASDEYLNYAVKNRQEWEREGREIVEKMVSNMKEKAQKKNGKKG